MALDASILEQLQGLRKWQLQQQEELQRQQEEQREKLNDEHNRMYQALNLSIDEMTLSDQSLKGLTEQKEDDLINLDTPDEGCSPTPQKCHSFSQYPILNNNQKSNFLVPKVQLAIRKTGTDMKPNTKDMNSYNQNNYSSELSFDGMQSFSSKNLSVQQIPIDELPIISPKKDFNTLLEERLQDSEAANDEKKGKPVIKRPFLKKGEGLARFMPNLKHSQLSKITRPRSASYSSGMTPKSTKPQKANLQRCNSLSKSREKDFSRKCTSNPTPVARTKLTLKNVPSPQKKARSKSIGSLPNPLAPVEKEVSTELISDCNSSDLEVKNNRELEEVRIFELLEDKANNSSFCSTSSTVIAFLQQSTPLKHKAFLHSASKQKISLDDIGDQTLEEIVRTTESNHLPNPQMQKMIRDQYFSQWDAIPVSKLRKKTVTGTILPYGTDIEEDSNQESSHDENNVSLHVRFAEYNEYKTMTDTSSISSDSQTVINFMNDKGAWSDDSVTPDSSDVESISSQLKSDSECNINSKQTNYRQENGHYSDEDNTELFNNDEENEEVGEELESKNTTLQTDDTIIDEKVDNAVVFKSELLKTRLMELEQEIETFRKESAALCSQRQRLQEERVKVQEEKISLQRRFKEREEALEIEKRKTESILQEEKKRLSREKAALESRMKDAWEKSQKSKQERHELQTLRDQLEELKEELNQKESKWSATNARQRSQMRVLQTENSKLKQEIEKLQQKKNAKYKKPVISNTKAIHQINKFLADRKKISPFKNDDMFEENAKIPSNSDANTAADPNTKISCENNLDVQTDYNADLETGEENLYEEEIVQNVEKVKLKKTAESIARTRNLYESLLRDATEGFTDDRTNQRNLVSQSEQFREEMLGDYPNDFEDHHDESLENKITPNSKNINNLKSPQTSSQESDEFNRNEDCEYGQNKSRNNKQGIREVHQPDGRIEYWYPNGNVKKVFPDKCLTKMIYYNGDVRETDKNGTVKYFYASTRTWHTTMPDGLEILEFPDGQVERRSKDGTVEVSFPDGSVKIIQSDGTEKWALRDGTIAETLANGEKILTLPNGQKEIHNNDHKRREYPDGTVKLVYPDGTQETRYANGRVRIKDKDGNLLMDRHQ